MGALVTFEASYESKSSDNRATPSGYGLTNGENAFSSTGLHNAPLEPSGLLHRLIFDFDQLNLFQFNADGIH